MIQLRPAHAHDLPYLTGLEQKYNDLGFTGCDSENIHKQRMENGDSAYLLVERDGSAAGYVILCGLDSANRSIELKRIAVAEPGGGAGREALRLVLRHVFRDLSAHRLWLDVYTDNERARRVYRALGFVEEGTMRECIWQHGRFRSLVLMSMLEAEYKNDN